MATEEDICRLAEANIQIRQEWLKSAKAIAADIPFVEKAMQWDMRCAEAFQSIPSGYGFAIPIRLQNSLTVENTFLMSNQANPPQVVTTYYSGTGSAVAYAVGTEVASFLSSCAQNGPDQVKVWASDQLTHFAEPLQEDESIAVISGKLQRLYPGLAAEFQEAMHTTRTVIAGASITSSAGIAMRNILETFKGHMLEAARNRIGKKNHLKWEEAARIVAKGGPTSFEANQLVSKETEWRQLHDETSKLAKNDSKMMAFADLQPAYFRWLGLLRSSLSFIELNDGT